MCTTRDKAIMVPWDYLCFPFMSISYHCRLLYITQLRALNRILTCDNICFDSPFRIEQTFLLFAMSRSVLVLINWFAYLISLSFDLLLSLSPPPLSLFLLCKRNTYIVMTASSSCHSTFYFGTHKI